MTHVLTMSAGKFGHPFPFCVEIKSYNGLLHDALLCLNDLYSVMGPDDPLLHVAAPDRYEERPSISRRSYVRHHEAARGQSRHS